MSNTWSPYALKYDPVKIGSIDGTDTYPHDHGIVRASSANFQPNVSKLKNPKLTLFVSKLDGSVTEKDLEKVFSRYGDVKRVSLVRDIVTGFSKRYCFVEFKDVRECERARRKTHKTILKNKEILVDFECQQTLPGWVPRRLGGGFGGRKESGQLRFGCLDRPWKKPIALQYADQEFQRKQDSHRNNHESLSKREERESESWRHERHHHREDHNERSSKRQKR